MPDKFRQRVSSIVVCSGCVLAGLAGPALGAGDAASGQVRGIVKAAAEATISSELVALVVRAPFKAGEEFSRNEAILEFDCRRYLADLTAATAEAKSARLTLDLNHRLRRRQAIGAHELALSEVKLDQAKAAMIALEVRADQCIIKAPFDGAVVERLINEHEMPQPNTPLLRIVKKGGLELGLVVPSEWLVWLKPGLAFKFRIEETRSTHDANVERVGAVVDPISRTSTVRARLISASEHVRPGMSGTASFKLPNH